MTKAYFLWGHFRKPSKVITFWTSCPFTSSNIARKQAKVNKNTCFILYIQEDEYIAQDPISFKAIRSIPLNGTQRSDNQASGDILGIHAATFWPLFSRSN